MDKEKWTIPIPADEVIEQEVNYIVKKGLPPKQRFLPSLMEMGDQVGWRFIGPGRNETILTAAVSVFVILLFLVNETQSIALHNLYGMIFLFSPVALFCLAGFSFFERYSQNTFELEMTMKYTFFQLLAFRMLFFSGVSIVVNVSFVLGLATLAEIDVVRAMLLSLTGLFIFSAGLLLSLHRGRFLTRGILFIALWLVINGALLAFERNQYILFIHELPIIVYVGILIGCMMLYLYSLRFLFYRKLEEV